MTSIQTLNNPEDWVFFARGNANMVYKYTGHSQQLSNKLLRLRLDGQHYNTLHVHQFITESITPILPDVLSMELVKVPFSVEGSLNDGYGLLMPNVLIANGKSIRKGKYFELYTNGSMYMLEMKPKWLRRTKYGCRNCAHHMLKHGEVSRFCSLDLLDPSRVKKVVSDISDDYEVRLALAKYLERDDNIFQVLQRLQKSIHLESLGDESDVTNDLCLQMTLRDLTIFITIEEQQVTGINITDVDPKHPSKWESWATTENKLISLAKN